MQLLIIVLNRVECLEELLEKLADRNISGATILDSKGMAHSLKEYDGMKFTNALRLLLDPERSESKTVFMVIKDENVPVVSEIVNKVTGGLNNPDTGILFTVPIGYTEGFINA